LPCPQALPLGTSYPAILVEVGGLLQNPILRGCTLILGATGVGRPLVEMFREAKLPAKLQPVFIKTGEHESSRTSSITSPKSSLFPASRFRSSSGG